MLGQAHKIRVKLPLALGFNPVGGRAAVVVHPHHLGHLAQVPQGRLQPVPQT